VPSFTESAQTVYTDETISFDASASYDPDGSIVSYFWDFGDGTNGTGVIVSHSYLEDSDYVVTLTVTDDRASTSTTTASKTILNRPPAAMFTESAETVYGGELITFNATASFDPDGTIASYYWDFGDGTNKTGPVANHIYFSSGDFTVTLTVADNDGAFSSAESTKTVLGGVHDVAVTEVAPSAAAVYRFRVLNVSVIVANEGAEPETFNVTLHASDLGAIQTLTVFNLNPLTQTTLTFSWDVSTTPSGFYTLTATADVILGETDTSDNSFEDGQVQVKINPDIDGDGDVDIYDAVIVSGLYGVREGEPGWNPRADVIADGVINIYDVVAVSDSYGKKLYDP